MHTLFAALTCCLLAISFAAAQPEEVNFTATKPPVLNNMTQTTELITSSPTAGNTTSTSKVNEDTTAAFTLDKTSIQPQTSQSTASMTPLTNSPSLPTSTPAAHTPTSTVFTVPASETTTGYTRTPETTEITTANSSRTVNTTSHSVDATTQGLGLNISEQNITIVFSVVLGVFVLSLVGFMYHRYRQKIQYLHQPLNNSDCPDAFGVDDDTLIISGGLYDGHALGENAPAAPDNESRFRLEFLH